MTIYEKRRGSVGILSLNGSFVGKSGASLFERAIFGLLKDDCTSIILDLAELKFIDSAGLGAIIAAMVSVGRREGALKLAAVRGDVQKTVTGRHLDQVFELHASVEQAVASYVKKGKT